MKITVLMGILALTLTLAGCNGGGSSSPASSQPTNQTPTSSPAPTQQPTQSNPTSTTPAPVSVAPTPTSTSNPTTTPTSTPTPVPGATYNVSGTIMGGTTSGITITATPGGSSAMTGKNGTYTLTNLPAGQYTITPSYGAVAFTPAVAKVFVSGSAVTGINFSNPYPQLKNGKILYPCTEALCKKDLATGTKSTVIVMKGQGVDNIIPFLKGNKIAYSGSNIGGVMISSMLSPSPQLVYVAHGLTTDCLGGSAGVDNFSVANTVDTGDVMITSVTCSYPGIGYGSNIFIIKMDGSSDYVQVTTGQGTRSSPVMGTVDSSGKTAVFYVKTIKIATISATKGDIAGEFTIMKQIVNLQNQPTLVGSPTVFEKGVIPDVRALSLNASRTKVAFVKDVKGLHHIFVKSLSGGTAVDIGVGDNPYWSLQKIGGSTLILCSDTKANKLFAVKPDGSGRMSVPVTSSILDYSSLLWVVFAPPAN